MGGRRLHAAPSWQDRRPRSCDLPAAPIRRSIEFWAARLLGGPDDPMPPAAPAPPCRARRQAGDRPGKSLMVHAPAVMDEVVERDLNDSARRRFGAERRTQRTGEIDPVEAQD